MVSGKAFFGRQLTQGKEMLRQQSCLDRIDIVEKAIYVSKDGGMELLHFGKIKEMQLLPG